MKEKLMLGVVIATNRARKQAASDESMRARIDNFAAALWSAGKTVREIDRLKVVYLERLQRSELYRRA